MLAIERYSRKLGYRALLITSLISLLGAGLGVPEMASDAAPLLERASEMPLLMPLLVARMETVLPGLQV